MRIFNNLVRELVMVLTVTTVSSLNGYHQENNVNKTEQNIGVSLRTYNVMYLLEIILYVKKEKENLFLSVTRTI